MEEVLVMIDMNHFRLFRPMISQIRPLLIIIFSIALIPSHSQTATTEVPGPVCDYDATNSTYTCVCDEEQECYHQNIVCENDRAADCTVECTGKKSCDGANILCPDNGDCTVECGGQTSCARSTIACADSTNCAVQCTSTAACYGADILWPSTPTGTIVCSGGRQSCYNTNFPIPPPDEDFSLNCDKEAECSYAEIYCPEFANCDITCSARFACRFAYIHWSPNDVQSTLSCTYGDRECEGLNLPPTSSPTMEPTVEPTIQSASPTVSTTSPTTVPTVQSVAPSGHPSTTPTKHPSISPTTPSSSPTEYPSKTPTETPTISTNDPSVTPTKHPSISPTTPSSSPSKYPSKTPTETPIRPPSDNPSLRPTVSPTIPTNDPSSAPTTSPTTQSSSPTKYPSTTPTETPLRPPTESPSSATVSPTESPSLPVPTSSPTEFIDTVCGYDAINSTYLCVCDKKEECMSKTITCPNDINCRLDCSEYQSCKSTNIICATNTNCTVECTGYSSCYNANIQWPSSGTSALICSGIYRSCLGANFPVPPPDEDFTLDCDAAAACEKADIYCPENADCHIICSEYLSCKNAYIHWSANANVLSTLSCTFGSDECEGVNLPPSRAPTLPSVTPTAAPTSPTALPTAPTTLPTENPTVTSAAPTGAPTTAIPTTTPTTIPTTIPTVTPTVSLMFTTDNEPLTPVIPHNESTENNVVSILIIAGIAIVSICIIMYAIWIVFKTKAELDIVSEPGNMFGVPEQKEEANVQHMMRRVVSISSENMDEEVRFPVEVGNDMVNDVEGDFDEIENEESDTDTDLWNKAGEDDIETLGHVHGMRTVGHRGEETMDNVPVLPDVEREYDVDDDRKVDNDIVTLDHQETDVYNSDGEPNEGDIVTKDEETTGK